MMPNHISSVLGNSLIQAVDPWFWAYTNQIELASGPFEMTGHEYQAEVMCTDFVPVKVVMKATGMTFTEVAVLDVLHGMIHRRYPQGVAYFFPTKDDVTDFSKSRFNPLIQQNTCIGAYVQQTDSAAIKRIQDGFLYFRSGRLHQDIQKRMKASSRILSIQVDHCVFDEWDQMDPKAEGWAEGRMGHSKVKTMFFLANPTIPDYGIDKKFQLTDQRYWQIKCQHCGKWTCLEETFPECLQERKGNVIRACMRCGREIYPKDGEWVAKRPSLSQEAVGWTISHLNSMYEPPKRILKKFNDPNTDIGVFTRFVLGRAYIEAENRVSAEEVLALCTNKGIASSDSGPCFMGVDQHGEEKKGQYVVIGKKHPRAHGEIIHLNVYKTWGDLDPLIKRFNVVRCVVDAEPDLDKARAFASRHKGIVYLHWYNHHQKDYYKWDEKDMRVLTNRTESLDASQKQIQEEAIFFPKRTGLMETFADHCNNIAKQLEEDELTGSKRYVYIKLGPDHYRHAFNYETIARQNAPDLLFPGLK